jgi:hypothetical protein
MLAMTIIAGAMCAGAFFFVAGSAILRTGSTSDLRRSKMTGQKNVA